LGNLQRLPHFRRWDLPKAAVQLRQPFLLRYPPHFRALCLLLRYPWPQAQQVRVAKAVGLPVLPEEGVGPIPLAEPAAAGWIMALEPRLQQPSQTRWWASLPRRWPVQLEPWELWRQLVQRAAAPQPATQQSNVFRLEALRHQHQGLLFQPAPQRRLAAQGLSGCLPQQVQQGWRRVPRQLTLFPQVQRPLRRPVLSPQLLRSLPATRMLQSQMDPLNRSAL